MAHWHTVFFTYFRYVDNLVLRWIYVREKALAFPSRLIYMLTGYEAFLSMLKTNLKKKGFRHNIVCVCNEVIDTDTAGFKMIRFFTT